MSKTIDKTIINPYYHELRPRMPRAKKISEEMGLKINRASILTEEIFGLMDDYHVTYNTVFDCDLMGKLAYNNNKLTIDMLDVVTRTRIDGQVGKIIVDHINNDVFDTHSYGNHEWKAMDE